MGERQGEFFAPPASSGSNDKLEMASFLKSLHSISADLNGN